MDIGNVSANEIRCGSNFCSLLICSSGIRSTVNLTMTPYTKSLEQSKLTTMRIWGIFTISPLYCTVFPSDLKTRKIKKKLTYGGTRIRSLQIERDTMYKYNARQTGPTDFYKTFYLMGGSGTSGRYWQPLYA